MYPVGTDPVGATPPGISFADSDPFVSLVSVGLPDLLTALLIAKLIVAYPVVTFSYIVNPPFIPLVFDTGKSFGLVFCVSACPSLVACRSTEPSLIAWCTTCILWY